MSTCLRVPTSEILENVLCDSHFFFGQDVIFKNVKGDSSVNVDACSFLCLIHLFLP